MSSSIAAHSNERWATDFINRFCELALTAPAESLERIINRPIYPGRVEHRR